MFELKNKTILILSPEDWGDNLLSKHLYAQELSKNNLVYFLHTSPHPQQKELISTFKIQENITLIHFKKVARGIFKLPSFLIDLQNKYLIQKLYNKIEQPIDLVWSFDQSKFQNLKQFKAKKTIFHPVDYIKLAQPFVSRIANSANVVLSVSEKILDTVITSSPKYFVNHGIDSIFFNQRTVHSKPDFIKVDKINVGYVGNLQMKFIDWENLINTVRENSDVNFVFIGPYQSSNLGSNQQTELHELMSYSNTVFTGEMNKNKLTESLSFLDSFWLCYDYKKYPIEVSNSHKILEYLSTGKVVVSNYISTYKNQAILEMIMDNNLLAEKLKEVTSSINQFNAIEKQQQRINFAKENTYAKQLERIEIIINSLNA